MSKDMAQEEIRALVPEQLRRQMFDLRLHEGTYCMAYDDLGKTLALASRGGHMLLLRLEDFELQAEKRLYEGVSRLQFLEAGILAAAVESRLVIFDRSLLALHNLFYGTCVGMEYLREHLLLASAHAGFKDSGDAGALRYTDITSGHEVACIALRKKPLRVRQRPGTGIVAVSF